MKILLIVPANVPYRVTESGRRVPRRAMLRFSTLPVTTVAAATPPPHTVVICDENVEMLDVSQPVDLVGISVMTATVNRGREIAAMFRSRGIPVVAGGYHATLSPEDIRDDFDAVVVGDAEGVWPVLVDDVEKGWLKGIYRSDVPPDLSHLPVPRRDLVSSRSDHYVTRNAMQIGRGCRHGCRYCSITAFHGQTYRRRPVPHVLAELRTMSRDLIFVDDNIVMDPDYARELFTAMIPLKKRWVSQASITIADDPELLRLAHRSGCRGLFIGIESVNGMNLDVVSKGFNRIETYVDRIAAIRGHGIGIIAGIIVGMEYDDVTVFEKTLRFLQRTRIDAIQVNIMTPLPGTPLHREFLAAGRIIDADYDHYDFRHCVFQPRRMSPEQLQNGADWLYRQFYRLDRVIVRTLRTLTGPGLIPAYLTWRLNLTYRFDNKRESIIGSNPAREIRTAVPGVVPHSGNFESGKLAG